MLMETRTWLIIPEKLFRVIERPTQSRKMVMIRWADECFGHLTLDQCKQASWMAAHTLASFEGEGQYRKDNSKSHNTDIL